MTLAQSLQVVAQAAHVDVRLAANRNCMRNAVYLELANGELSGLDRVIDQLRVVVGLVGSECVRLRILSAHGRRDPPVRCRGTVRGHDLELAGQVLLTGNGEEYAGTVEVGMRVIEVRAANAEIGLGTNRHDVARIVANHVATRYPGRHRKHLPFGVGTLDRQPHLEKVGARVMR